MISGDTFLKSKIRKDENGRKINGYTMNRCDRLSDDDRVGKKEFNIILLMKSIVLYLNPWRALISNQLSYI